MSDENKELLFLKLKDSKPQIEEVISEYFVDENLVKSVLGFVEWLRVKGIEPLYTYCEGQSPFWEVGYKGKKHFIVWDDAISIMVKADYTDEFQAFICENNLQEVVLEHLQKCSRVNGEQCSNCDIPHDAIGVDRVLFGKEVKHICCGKYISFSNPNNEVVEVIKKFLEY